MAGASTVNFFAPGTDSGLEYAQLQRQRDLAAMLMQRGQASPQGTMAGNIYVPPSALSYVAQLANSLAGGYKNAQTDDKERALLQDAQARRAQEASGFMQALNGTPGTTQEAAGPYGGDIAQPTQTVGAQAPDRAKALAIALQSSNPALQGMGGELMKRQMSEQELASIMAQYGGAGAATGGAAGAGGDSSAPAAGGPGAAPAGGVAGVNPLAFALAASGRDKLGSMIQDASKPVNITEGGTLFNPGTGQVMFTAPKTEAGIAQRNGVAGPVPGFQEAQARRAGMVAGAEAAARDQFAAPTTVDMPGGPRMLTPAQQRQLAGGAAPLPGYANEGQMKATVGGDMGGDSGALDRQIAGMTKELPNVKDAASRTMMQNEIDRLTDQRARYFGAAQAQPAAPSAAPDAPGIPVQSADAKAYNEARAKDFAGQAAGFQKAGQQASSMLRNLDELKTLYADPNVAKGALAENISGLKNIGASFGVDMKGLSSEQAAEAITNKMALDMRSTADGGGMPGAMSDADRNHLKALTPNLTKSPEGRAKIMEAQQKVAQRQIDVARLANEYEQKNGRLDAGFDKVLQDYAAKNRMFTQAQPGGGFKIIGVQ